MTPVFTFVVIVVTWQLLCGHCAVSVVTWQSSCGLTWSLGGNGITNVGDYHYPVIMCSLHAQWTVWLLTEWSLLLLRDHCVATVVTTWSLSVSCDHYTVLAATM